MTTLRLGRFPENQCSSHRKQAGCSRGKPACTLSAKILQIGWDRACITYRWLSTGLCFLPLSDDFDFIVALAAPFACEASRTTLAAGVLVTEVLPALEAIFCDWRAQQGHTAVSSSNESSSKLSSQGRGKERAGLKRRGKTGLVCAVQPHRAKPHSGTTTARGTRDCECRRMG